MQWSADITEHAHIEEIKLPVHTGNNQNYYSQIMHHLDRLESAFVSTLSLTLIGMWINHLRMN